MFCYPRFVSISWTGVSRYGLNEYKSSATEQSAHEEKETIWLIHIPILDGLKRIPRVAWHLKLLVDLNMKPMIEFTLLVILTIYSIVLRLGVIIKQSP